MIKWFLYRFDASRRKLDMKILWPTIQEQAPNEDIARSAMLFHITNDRAWTRWYSRNQLLDIVNNLEMASEKRPK